MPARGLRRHMGGIGQFACGEGAAIQQRVKDVGAGGIADERRDRCHIENFAHGENIARRTPIRIADTTAPAVAFARDVGTPDTMCPPCTRPAMTRRCGDRFSTWAGEVSTDSGERVIIMHDVLQKPRVFYGWFVVAAAFAVTFVGFGCAYTFSAFIESLQRDFAASRGSVSLVFSLAGFLYF